VDNVGLGLTASAGTVVLAKTSSGGVHAIGGAGLTIDGGATVRLGGTGGDQIFDLTGAIVTVNGTLDLNARSEGVTGLSGTGTVDNVSAGGSATLTVGTNNQSAVFFGVIQNTTGTVSLTKTGTGTQQLAGAAANTYSGPTTVQTGVLELNKTAGSAAIPAGLVIGENNGGATGTVTLLAGNQIADAAVVTVQNDGVLNLNNFSETIGAFVGAVGSQATLGTATLTTGGNGTNDNFAGMVSGVGGSFTKVGAGTQRLDGANTYTGTTTVTAGRLDLNGSIVNGPAANDVVVNSGGTFGGLGTTNGGGVLVNSGGRLSPGNSPGVINTGSLTLSGGAFYDVELAAPYTTAGTGYDQTNVTGIVSLGGATPNLTGGSVAGSPGQTLTIINNDGADAVTGTFGGLPDGTMVTSGGFTAFISYFGGDGNDVTLTVGGATPVLVGTGGNDSFEVRRVGGTTQVLLGGVVVYAAPTAAISTLQIDGAGGNDNLSGCSTTPPPCPRPSPSRTTATWGTTRRGSRPRRARRPRSPTRPRR